MAQKLIDNLTKISLKSGADFNLDINSDAFGRWLPNISDAFAIEDFLGNLGLYPESLPQTKKDLLFYQAYIRERIRSQIKQTSYDFTDKVAKLIIPEEILSFSPSDNFSVLLFLDSFAPVNIFEIYDQTERVVTCICPQQMIVDRQEDVVEPADIEVNIKSVQSQKLALSISQIVHIPTKLNQKIDLNFDGKKSWSLYQKPKIGLEIFGGRFGIVFDLRGRPFLGPENTSEGRAKLTSWWKTFGIDPKTF